MLILLISSLTLFISFALKPAFLRSFSIEFMVFSLCAGSELIEFIKPLITPNVNILIKASRFMKFEAIVDALTIGKY